LFVVENIFLTTRVLIRSWVEVAHDCPSADAVC